MKLARATGRHDVTALRLRHQHPQVLVAFIFLIMGHGVSRDQGRGSGVESGAFRLFPERRDGDAPGPFFALNPCADCTPRGGLAFGAGGHCRRLSSRWGFIFQIFSQPSIALLPALLILACYRFAGETALGTARGIAAGGADRNGVGLGIGDFWATRVAIVLAATAGGTLAVHTAFAGDVSRDHLPDEKRAGMALLLDRPPDGFVQPHRIAPAKLGERGGGGGPLRNPLRPCWPTGSERWWRLFWQPVPDHHLHRPSGLESHGGAGGIQHLERRGHIRFFA